MTFGHWQQETVGSLMGALSQGDFCHCHVDPAPAGMLFNGKGVACEFGDNLAMLVAKAGVNKAHWWSCLHF